MSDIGQRAAASRRAKLVLFDLDGTLADTAADLVAPVQSMRGERGLEPMPFEALRPYASMGARGLIARALGVEPAHPDYLRLREEFLERYEAAMNVHTRLFPGVPEVLDALEAGGLRWGVVSNKIERLVKPILEALGILDRALCAIGGDTTPFAKPHPEPLLHAARLASVQARECIYVGDDLRDIVAGRAAQMRTVAAAYGFCGVESPPHTWGADDLIDRPIDLLGLPSLRRESNAARMQAAEGRQREA